MSSHKINHANIKEWAKNYNGELFDGILCDPPYELGFMGKSWDSSGIAFDAEMWADILKLLKPGGHLLAFSGSRTYHRMAVAIEDAGFEIRDMIEWVYGSGFPKSLNIGKAVDKIHGKEVTTTYEPNYKNDKFGKGLGGGVTDNTQSDNEYNGYGTALKPAHEPCVLARKPLEKGHTVATNALKHGTGGLNIDGTRVGTNGETPKGSGNPVKNADPLAIQPGRSGGNGGNETSPLGRFPANLIHDGSDEVGAVFPQTKGEIHNKLSTGDSMFMGDGVAGSKRGYSIKDSGSASRFFYTAKSSRAERNAGLDKPNTHPTLKPLSLTKYLATLIKPPTGGRLLVPFSGSGSEMIGALQAGWEFVEGVELTEEYIPIAEARIKYWTKDPEQRKLL